MAITDKEAIRFQNEVIRVMAEKTRDFKIDIDLTLQAWYAGMNVKFVNSAEETVLDGRDVEGVGQLTGADANNLMGVFASIKSVLDGAGVSDVVQKPCVRILSR